MTDPTSNDTPEPRAEPDVPAWAHRAKNAEPMADQRMAAFIGTKWEGTYRQKFAPFFEDPSFVPTWNWSAFFVTSLWFLYRKLYLAFIIFTFAPTFALSMTLGPEVAMQANANPFDPAVQKTLLIMLSFAVSSMVAAGGVANWLLFRRARAATAFVASQKLSEDDALVMLGRVGGVHRGPTALMAALLLAPVLMNVCGTAPA